MSLRCMVCGIPHGMDDECLEMVEKAVKEARKMHEWAQRKAVRCEENYNQLVELRDRLR